jgi:hypothetical protein
MTISYEILQWIAHISMRPGARRANDVSRARRSRLANIFGCPVQVALSGTSS